MPSPDALVPHAAAARHPLIYSCSGCSSAAQMANHLALEIDRKGLAEMSCIAGVGGGVARLVRLARSGRPIVALDGCPLACARACLERVRVEPRIHLVLSQFGVKKMRGPFAPKQAERVLEGLEEVMAPLRSRHSVDVDQVGPLSRS